MEQQTDSTHDPALRSWVDSANDPASDFPIQNLPFGRFRESPTGPWRTGVAIGNKILDLERARLTDNAYANDLISLNVASRRSLRHAISAGLAEGSSQRSTFRAALIQQGSVEMGLPCKVGDYTDFYVGIHHATAVGKLFRPDNPLLPNYTWVPIGYHGRASTLRASGHTFRRPCGQVRAPDAAIPELRATSRLDFELELGLFIGKPNEMGHPIPMASAEEHLLGVTLLNDWSARDIQAWEYQPLGPFLSKSFATTLSPWIVTMEALSPFRKPFTRAKDQPQPLPYLDCAWNSAAGAINIDLEVLIQTSQMREKGLAPERISHSNYADAAFWTAAQLVTHHTVNGCGLNAGDLLGTGTLSGSQTDQAGSLLELTQGGKLALTLSTGERRTFIEDGDTVQIRGWCEREGYRRIGFGDCFANVIGAGEALPSTLRQKAHV